jgi:hypothetical protein
MPKTKNKSLAQWTYDQRMRFHSGKLKKERQKQLERIGFDFTTRVRCCESSFSELEILLQKSNS